jgi:hypothetical protein
LSLSQERHSKVYFAAVTVFAAGSFLCAAISFAWMLSFRGHDTVAAELLLTLVTLPAAVTGGVVTARVIRPLAAKLTRTWFSALMALATLPYYVVLLIPGLSYNPVQRYGLLCSHSLGGGSIAALCLNLVLGIVCGYLLYPRASNSSEYSSAVGWITAGFIALYFVGFGLSGYIMGAYAARCF